jgi:hypothetical protein
MNTQLITASYNEAIQVDFTQDAWFNATAVAAQFDKRPNDWLALESTKEYMSALSEISKYQESWYLKTKRGKHGGGTWMHPKLAIPFARWLDVRFAVWCDLQIELILKGTAQPSPTPLPKSQKALPEPPADPFTKEVHSAINRRAHALSLRHYDWIKEQLREAIRKWGKDLEGQKLLELIQTIDLPDSQLVIVHRNDLWALTYLLGSLDELRDKAMAALHKIEADTGMMWHNREH